MIETQKIPLFNPAFRNADQNANNGTPVFLFDGYRDDLNAFNTRPGLDQLTTLGSAADVDGLYYWANLGVTIAVSGGNIYKIAISGGTATVTNLTSATLLTGSPCTFATDGTYVFIANGTRIVYTNGTATTSYIADADAPTAVTHVAWLDGYLLANSVGTNKFYFSEVTDAFTWSALDFASAAGHADNIVALKVVRREIYLIGTETTEIWENDGSTPFARVPGGFVESGCIAAGSVVRDDDSLVWLSDDREFVTSDGRGIQRLSNPYSKEVQSFGSLSDASGDRIAINGRTFLVFHFNGEDRTLVYCKDNNDWYEWGNWDTGLVDYRRFKGKTYCYHTSGDYHLWGGAQGVIYRMSSSYYDDDGALIRRAIRTGHIDHGTTKRKRNAELRFRARRGDGLSSGTPQLMIRWRNNGTTSWSTEKTLSLGDSGDTNHILSFYRQGIYRTRQYEITCTDAVPLVLVDAEEDYEIL